MHFQWLIMSYHIAGFLQVQVADQRVLFDDSSSHLRWFILPSEANLYLKNTPPTNLHRSPFFPLSYPLNESQLKHQVVPPYKPTIKKAWTVADEEWTAEDVKENCGSKSDAQSENIAQQNTLSGKRYYIYRDLYFSNNS